MQPIKMVVHEDAEHIRVAYGIEDRRYEALLRKAEELLGIEISLAVKYERAWLWADSLAEYTMLTHILAVEHMRDEIAPDVVLHIDAEEITKDITSKLKGKNKQQQLKNMFFGPIGKKEDT